MTDDDMTDAQHEREELRREAHRERYHGDDYDADGQPIEEES